MLQWHLTKRVEVVVLIIECPFGEALPDCPLSELRKLPLSERIEHYKLMTDEELGGITAYHEQCLKKRET